MSLSRCTGLYMHKEMIQILWWNKMKHHVHKNETEQTVFFCVTCMREREVFVAMEFLEGNIE